MFLSKIMKKVIIISMAVLMHNVASAESIKDKSPYYIRLDAGISQPKGKLNNDDIYFDQSLKRAEFYGAGVGYIFNENIRSDLTLTGRSNYKFSYSGSNSDDTVNNANQKIQATSLMLNTYYTVPVNNVFVPYINAGIGVSKIFASDYSSLQLAQNDLGEIEKYAYSSGSSTKYNFAWNLGFGTQIKSTNDLAIDVFFRFIDLGKTKTQNISIYKDGVYQSSEKSRSWLQSYEAGISLIYRF